MEQTDEDRTSVIDAITQEPKSVLDELRARREELKQDHTLDLAIPGYKQDGEDLLWVRYGTVPVRRAEQLGREVMKERKDDRTLLGAIDLLIEACQGIYVKRDGDLEPIDPNHPIPTLFEGRLAELLGFEATTAREVVREVFPTDHAILRQSIILSRWMQDTTIDVSEDLLGE